MNRRTELLVGSAMLILVMALFVPAIGRAKAKSERSRCVENLKQINLAWNLSVQGESPPMTILNLSNWVRDPKLFICPSDKARLNVTTWDSLRDKRSSYVCEACKPGPLKPMPLEEAQNFIVFRCSIHDNVALADGSVHMGSRFLTNFAEAQVANKTQPLR